LCRLPGGPWRAMGKSDRHGPPRSSKVEWRATGVRLLHRFARRALEGHGEVRSPRPPTVLQGELPPSSPRLVLRLHPDARMPDYRPDPVVGEILAAAIEVHRVLGPGLLESTYQTCLMWELGRKGIRVERQVGLPVTYKGVRLECGYRIDLLVDGDVIVEVKSVATLLPVHDAQVMTYLRLSGARRALLLNFNERRLKDAIRSFVPGKRVPVEHTVGSEPTHPR
jgi:GxxExxY protein